MTTIVAPDVTAHGLTNPDGGREFRGIRYAHAARFSPPVDQTGESYEADAVQWGSLCPQNPGFLELMAGYDANSASEDCLSLNVFSPADCDEGSRLPVLFWIHGGAYLTGGGSLSWYHGSHLARRGAVVVTINYRLGALGYLGRDNLGTLDQISALRWTHRNIQAFGGDPGNVTVFGESAGGSALVALMASPDAAGLFHRAWAMSPSIGQLRDAQRADDAMAQYLDLLGASTLDDLRSESLDSLLKAQATLAARASRGFDHFSPAGGGAALPHGILDAAARCPVPLVIGTTRDENKLFTAFDDAARAATIDDWHAETDRVFGDAAVAARRLYEDLRGGEPWELISALNTDVAFRQPAVALASARANMATPTWMYWFTHASTAFGGRFGSCHALDIPFMFGTLAAEGAEAFTGSSEHHSGVSEQMSGELLRLSTHAHPGWAQYDTVSRATLEIHGAGALLHDPESEIRHLFM
ncbi:MAG: carboxylesterase/lipase family protein [Ilumatobacteraceae bacterium]